MENVYFDKTQKTLLSLLGHNLFAAELDLPSDVDWDTIIEESRMQSVPVSAFENYNSLPLSDEKREELRVFLKHVMKNNLFCIRNHAYIHKLMSSNGIPYCMLKGVASASYYPDPLMRNMGDVDFYVHPDDLERAERVLLDDGFVHHGDKNHAFHIGYAKDNIRTEMHFKPIGFPPDELVSVFDEYWSDIIESSVESRAALAQCRLPSPFHHGFVMLTHMQNHLMSEGVGLRHYCDWAVFANSFSNEEFILTFEKKLKRVGLWRLAQVLSLGACENLGMPYKEWMGDDRKSANELLCDIIRGGNFGRKDTQKTYEGYFLSNGGGKGVNKNRIVRAISSVNRRVNSIWDAPKKYPILYPLGWIYISIRLLFRIITGKRRISFVRAYKQSGKRKELYSRIKLLEPEE